MKIFICNRSIELQESDLILEEFLSESKNAISVYREVIHSPDWKVSVAEKLAEVDFVVFLLGNKTFESLQIQWEYQKAKSLNKNIVAIKIFPSSSRSLIFYQGFPVFESTKQCYKYLKKAIIEDRNLKLEQYKMMVSSTEKVTEQRLKVNNLFFTVTSSILSVAFLIGKTFKFSNHSIVGVFILTTLAFLTTFFWEKLINSYGQLNTGKFKVINRLEKELNTNMFEEEWKILLNEVGYKSNTETERIVIKRFRYFILFVAISEFIYLLNH